MEQTPHGYNWEGREPARINEELAAKGHVSEYKNGEQIIAVDHSYVFESIADYKNDLQLIESVIAGHAERLADLQRRDDDLVAGLADRIAFVERQIDFWKHAKAETAWLLAQAIQRDASELNALRSVPTDIEQ